MGEVPPTRRLARGDAHTNATDWGRYEQGRLRRVAVRPANSPDLHAVRDTVRRPGNFTHAAE